MNYHEKTRQKIVQEIITSLDKEIIPWRKSWTSTYKHINGNTENVYRGKNQLLLQLYAVARGFNDPRWMTFEQARKENLRIKKGSTGLSLMKYTLYNSLKKTQITKSDFHQLSSEEQQYVRASVNYFTVFNAEQVEGIGPYELNLIKPNKTLIKMAVEAYLEQEGIKVVNDDRAAYYSGIDNIAMPPIVHFDSEDDYYAVLLHEIGHSTGSKERLNRSERGDIEELVAELTSVMVGVEFGLNYNQSLAQNHTSYCQHWSKRLSDNKDEFFEAVNMANKASEYILDKMDLINLRKEFKLKKDDLIKIKIEEIRNKQIDVSKLSPQEFKKLKLEITALHSGFLTVDEYLRNQSANLPFENIELEELKSKIQISDYARSIGLNVKREGKYYSLVDHDSCKIYPDNNFYRFSVRKGGDIFEFIKMFEEVDFPEAVDRARVYYGENGLDRTTINNDIRFERELDIPSRVDHTDDVEKYLIRTRNISKDIVKDYIDKGIIYQDDHANVVFVGKDAEGIDVAYSKRGTKSKFKGVSAGSNMKVGVVIDSKSDSKTLIVTEGVIDAMSYQMMKDSDRNYNYLSTQSVNNAANTIEYYLENRGKQIEQIVIALDNDDAGIEVTKELIGQLNERYPRIDICYDFPEGKDWNDDLKKGTALGFSSLEKGVDVNVS